jgi:hypothetical protein
MQNLASAIEQDFYDRGLRITLAEQIRELDPDTKYHKGYLPRDLREELDRLENK